MVCQRHSLLLIQFHHCNYCGTAFGGSMRTGYPIPEETKERRKKRCRCSSRGCSRLVVGFFLLTLFPTTFLFTPLLLILFAYPQSDNRINCAEFPKPRKKPRCRRIPNFHLSTIMSFHVRFH